MPAWYFLSALNCFSVISPPWMKTLEALPGNENARRMAEDVDSFLASSWFRCLNDISQDMETVIKEELR